MSASDRHHNGKAIFYALLGFTCWTSGDILMKLAMQYGAMKHQVMLVGGISGMASLFAVAALRYGPSRLKPRSPWRVTFLACTFLTNYFLFLTGLPLLPLASFYAVIFGAPMMVAIIATFLLKEPMTKKKAAGIMAGFIGVMIALDPFRGHDFQPGELMGYGIAFISMNIMAVQMIALRVFGNYETRESLAFFPRCGALAGGIIGTILYGMPHMAWQAVACSVFTGIIGGFGWLSMAQAYRLARAATVAPFHYSQIITGMVLGYLIWGDVPSVHLILGAIIIIASGLYIATHAHRTEKVLEKQPI